MFGLLRYINYYYYYVNYYSYYYHQFLFHWHSFTNLPKQNQAQFVCQKSARVLRRVSHFFATSC